MERDALFREFNDMIKVQYEDQFEAASRVKKSYVSTIYSKCYDSLKPADRKRIAEEADKEFRRVTKFEGKLPPISQAKNDTELNLIRTWLRIRDIIVKRIGIRNLCPCAVPIPITIKDMHQFEKLGGITFKNHGPSLSLQTLRERLEKQIAVLRRQLGSKVVDVDFFVQNKGMFYNQGTDTGVQHEAGYFSAMKWIDEKLMLFAINDIISDPFVWEPISKQHREILTGSFLGYSLTGPPYPSVGIGFGYDWLLPAKGIVHIHVKSSMASIPRTTGTRCGWYIERAFPVGTRTGLSEII